jgi:ribonuclease HII
VSAAKTSKRAGGLCVGVDENGLGPRLGPLVVTQVAARVTPDGERIATSKPRGALAEHIGDSKERVAFGDTALGEAWARVLVSEAAGTPGRGPLTPDKVVRALSLDPQSTLEELCPEGHRAQCWQEDGEAFTADDALLVALGRDVTLLRDRGVELLGVRSVIVCTRRLNDAADDNVSRFAVDLHAMERLVLDAHARYGGEVRATCGKVGGYNRYESAFGPLSGRLLTTLEEGQGRSEYRFPGLGHVAFVRDADANHLLVALASLVGKWVRDLLTRRVTRYHRAHDATLPEASGYHDPVTARFVRLSALSRKSRGVPDECFERRAVSGPRPDA